MKTSGMGRSAIWPRAGGIGVLALLWLGVGAGCTTVRHAALDRVGDTFATAGTAFAGDDDPELIKAAAPLSLKLMESVLASRPQHRGLLTAAASGFTQYAYAFVQLEAEEVEEHDVAAAVALRQRARRLYVRARDYGLRGLAVAHPGWGERLRENPERAVAELGRDEVALLYWTACAWAGAAVVIKDDATLLADLPTIGALVAGASRLDADFDRGALHAFLIGWTMARPDGAGDPVARAREHYRRAVELCGDGQAGPHVALAEAVAVPQQDRAEFEALLRRALAVDPGAHPEWRLANTLLQRRARRLLEQADRYVEAK